LKSGPDFDWLEALSKAYPQVEVFLVGGQVRDLIIGRQSDDFEFVIINLSAQQVEDFLTQYGTISLVGKSFGVCIFRPTISDLTEEIEIALPRTDKSFNTGGYRDFEIQTDPTLPIEEDLKRRDFTINAMALNIATGEIIDPFDGQTDIKKKIIKAVGDPLLRFGEDYTRMLRGIRFAAQLLFKIEDQTFEAITSMASKIKDVPAERIQVELNKIMLSKNVEHAFELLKETGMLQFILPEIAEGIDVHQGKAHIYPVFEHLIKAADHASKRGYGLPTILGALFHDSGKPRTKAGDPVSPTFYQHEYVGEKLTKEALTRLKYPKDTIKKAAHLVRNHMFYYNMGEVTDAGIRRLIAKVGPDNIDDLIRLRIADRLGMGRPKAKPFKLVELERRVKIMQTAPITVQMLAIDGHDIMEILKIKPSIRIKHLQNALLNEVLDTPESNTKETLIKRLTELNKLSDQELIKLSPDFQEVESERKRDLLKGFKGVD
jgi:poly(A) polymerase/tRNA nucleotidyltransferase (CCA-adding enzyme)